MGGITHEQYLDEDRATVEWMLRIADLDDEIRRKREAG